MRERLSGVVNKISKTVITLTAATVMAFSGLLAAAPLFLSRTAYADSNAIVITNVTELSNAIENQADGQTWTIEPGAYGITPNTTITEQGQTGWYFPITANNLTINGVGNPTIYGNSYSANGALATQDLVAIFGDNVTINGLTLKPKVEPNKVIEVLGSNSTIENTTIEPNDIVDQSEYDLNDSTEKDWGGSIYYNNTTGAQTLTNVTIENGGISDHSPSSTLNLTNVNLDYSTATDWINSYRFATHGNPYTGSVNITYHVSGNANNLDDALINAQSGDTISLDSDLTTSQQITLTKAITLNGNGYTISPNFTKTSSDNNAAIGIEASGVTVKNLIEDGTSGTNLHGINIYASSGVILDTVSVSNNDHDGIVVNGSSVTVNNITTSGNGWGGIDVDQGSGVTSPAVLTVNGTSTHDELIPIQIDDLTKNVSVIDTNHQYSFHDSGNLRIYSLLQSDQSAPDSSGNATANSTAPQVVVSDASQPVTITVAHGTTNASVNYSALVSGNTGTIPQTTISAPAATVTIPASTTVTATGGTWDGTISAPTTTTVNLGSGKSVATAVEVGSDSLHLTFSNAVRLLLPGQAGKLVGFVRNGDFTQISNTCSADSQAAGDALPADGDCSISVGSDMVIWTKHFTTFVAYSNVTNPSSGGGSNTSSGSSNGSGSTSSASSSGSNGSSEGIVQGESTDNGKTSSTKTELPVANLAQPKTAAKEANGGGLRWYWIVLMVLAVIGLALAGVYRYAEGTDRR